MFYRCHKSADWTFLTKRKMSLCDWAPTENSPSELVRRLKLIDTLWNVCFRCPLAKQPPALMSHLSSHVVVFIGLILQIFFSPPLSLTVACCFLAWVCHFDVRNLSVICCCTALTDSAKFPTLETCPGVYRESNLGFWEVLVETGEMRFFKMESAVVIQTRSCFSKR